MLVYTTDGGLLIEFSLPVHQSHSIFPPRFHMICMPVSYCSLRESYSPFKGEAALWCGYLHPAKKMLIRTLMSSIAGRSAERKPPWFILKTHELRYWCIPLQESLCSCARRKLLWFILQNSLRCWFHCRKLDEGVQNRKPHWFILKTHWGAYKPKYPIAGSSCKWGSRSDPYIM